MTEQDKNKLRTGRDGRELKRIAVATASGLDPADLELIGTHLATSDFLHRMDDEKAYAAAYTSLRLATVMRALMDNRRAETDRVLLRLVDAPQYNGHLLRIQLLIRALAAINPSPPPAIAYWDKMSQPRSPVAFDVIEALCINRSDPAMSLLQAKLKQPAHDGLEKQAWMRQLMLPRRNDEAILKSARAVVQSEATQQTRIDMVESLYDYKPDEWYRGCTVPQAPLRVAAPTRSKQILLDTANWALEHLPLPPDLKATVEAAREELKQTT